MIVSFWLQFVYSLRSLTIATDRISVVLLTAWICVSLSGAFRCSPFSPMYFCMFSLGCLWLYSSTWLFLHLDSRLLSSGHSSLSSHRLSWSVGKSSGGMYAIVSFFHSLLFRFFPLSVVVVVGGVLVVWQVGHSPYLRLESVFLVCLGVWNCDVYTWY